MDEDEFFLLKIAYENQPEVTYAYIDAVESRFGNSRHYLNVLGVLDDKGLVSHKVSTTFAITPAGITAYQEEVARIEKIDREVSRKKTFNVIASIAIPLALLIVAIVTCNRTH